MIYVKRYVLIPVNEVNAEMRLNTIPYGIYPNTLIIEISGINYELLKWRSDKPIELWNEYPVYGNEEIINYINTFATLPPKPQPY